MYIMYMVHVMYSLLSMFVSASPASSQNTHVLPCVRTTLENGICPSDESRRITRSGLQAEIQSYLQLRDFALTNNCPCGGIGEWHRIAHLNMSDPNQQCPPNWRLISTPVRACGGLRNGIGCDSAVFPSNGVSYSRVCGRVIAYQRGTPSAFEPSFSGRSLEGVYIEGISITHGPVGSRQHIWSFAEALHDHPQGEHGPDHNCPCSDINHVWTRTAPAFIQNNYFCDSGNRGPGVSTQAVYISDPLWDGAGCAATSSCCEFNNPPWFCITLDQATSEDIEVRICMDEAPSNEDVDVELVDIYTM